MPAPGNAQQLTAANTLYLGNATAAVGMPFKDTLMDVTYSNQTATFNDANVLDTTGYRFLQVIAIKTVNSGSGITVQVDICDMEDADATRIDFYNAGAKTAPGTDIQFYGPGTSNNIGIPRRTSFTYTVAGTTPNFNLRVIVRGYN